MDSARYDAFWSYAHDDNSRQHGRVLQLADEICDEFAITTADELQFFVDRSALSWGDLWRERIDHALGDVPFFIAVVTPKYVKSPECRRELIAFSSAAKSRGFDRLLLPILYVPVDGLSEDSDDEVLALIARTQYVSWVDLRLLAPDDPRVLSAISELATRLKELRSQAVEVKRTIETQSAGERSLSLKEAIDAINSRLEGWMEAVEFDSVARHQWVAIKDERLARVRRLKQSRGHAGAILSVYTKLGQELLPVAKDRLEKAKSYSRLSIELDPIVTAATRIAKSEPWMSSLLEPLRDGVREAMLNIQSDDTEGFEGWGLDKSMHKYSRYIADADAAVHESMAYVNEANQIVEEWARKLHALEVAASSSSANSSQHPAIEQ